MAHYDIKYAACGHTGRISLLGKLADREHKIEWMQRDVCPECTLKAAKEKSAEAGLPDLKGSDKQVIWAEKIRAEKLTALKDAAKQIADKRGIAPAEMLPMFDAAGEIAEWVEAQTSASYWIDNRDVSFNLSWLTNEAVKRARGE